MGAAGGTGRRLPRLHGPAGESVCKRTSGWTQGVRDAAPRWLALCRRPSVGHACPGGMLTLPQRGDTCPLSALPLLTFGPEPRSALLVTLPGSNSALALQVLQSWSKSIQRLGNPALNRKGTRARGSRGHKVFHRRAIVILAVTVITVLHTRFGFQ